ncbi:MAG: MBL fold metallo-hydrolase [bacterium]|nr:MBL fold metallo-hydrolase [bacterium]
MKKIFFVIISFLVITLVMLLYIKFDKSTVIKTKISPSILPLNNSSVEYLKLAFLDVGQGDATFVEWPDGEQMLVDCGKDSNVLTGLGEVMPFYDKYIDYLLVTHPDLDHFGGCIDVIKRFDVGEVIYNGVVGDSDAWSYFWDLVESKKIKYTEINKFNIWDINNAQIKFLYPDSDISNENIASNDGSIVFVMSYGESDILFTGDAEEGLEKYLVENYENDLDVEVLKVAHHGSGGSSGKDFLAYVSPEYSVISVGAGNSYGHPSLRTIKRIERLGGEIFRTDLGGMIRFNIFKDNIERVIE